MALGTKYDVRLDGHPDVLSGVAATSGPIDRFPAGLRAGRSAANQGRRVRKSGLRPGCFDEYIDCGVVAFITMMT